MAKNDKTNVMRILEKAGIAFSDFSYDPTLTEGVRIAEALGEDPTRVFKTLVTEGGKGEHFVFVIPVAQTLDLKAAAKAVGVKSLAMLKQKDLLPLTGYIHGGCSPVGMKKAFPTVFDATAEALDLFYVSAGKVGRQIQVDPKALCAFVRGKFASITL